VALPALPALPALRELQAAEPFFPVVLRGIADKINATPSRR